MAAGFRSEIAAKPTVISASRDDLRAGDVVNLFAQDLTHSTYTWVLSFTPETVDEVPSTAVLSAVSGTTTSFTVDNPGAYLVALTVDSGIPATEDTKYFRLRYLTKFGDLKLVAAGERRDQNGVIPYDADPEGWANDQNHNLLVLLSYIEKVSTSGRVFYVDANRGLDSANSQNDPTIAEDYADYHLIQDAITAATAAVPAPTLTNPYVIKIQPGFYDEDLTLAPHVHLVGLGSEVENEQNRGVLVRANNLSGFNHRAILTNVGDFCFVDGIQFENIDSTHTNPVLEKSGSGTLILKNTSVVQNGNGLTQGAALSHTAGVLFGVDSLFVSNTVVTERLAFSQEGATTSSVFDRCEFRGGNAVDINSGNLADVTVRFNRCLIESTGTGAGAYAITSSADDLFLDWCRVFLSGGVSTTALQIHPLGDVNGTDVKATIRYTIIDGDITFDPTGVVGTTELNLGSVEYASLTLAGALTSQNATTQGDSIFFDNTASGFASENVQDALDQLAAILTGVGVGGAALSLDTAYDGILDPTTNPPTLGSGSGRTILADQGAVQIIGADPPAAVPPLNATDGRLQVEGPVEVGAIDAYEIGMLPNPYGLGPVIEMGYAVFPDIPGTTARSIPSATVRARSTGTPLFRNYNLTLETQSTEGGSNSEVGRIIIKGGDSLTGGGSPPDASSIYIQAGEAHAATGDPGDIWVAPGRSDSLATDGLIYIANPAAATTASLTAAGVFVGGVSGDITFAIAGVGEVTASILAGDAITDVQAKLNALPGITCVVNIANDPIEIVTEAKGPTADVIFAYDDQSGALNTALGDFSNGGGSVFVAGTFPETVTLACTGPGELTLDTDLIVTGSISGGAATLSRKTIAFGDSPYAQLSTDYLIGVDTSGGAITINLGTTLALVGTATQPKQLIIKDESGDAGAFPITIAVPGGVGIDGVASIQINTNSGSVTLYSNGLTGASTEWFVI